MVVFDDVTRLIAAQRSAAWGEVARRLAHEIKNPLTPIQLSAERLQMKLSGKVGNGDAEMLDRSTQTIINQVQAMKRMVNDFSDYARMPAPELAALDLNALVLEVLGLYETSRATIETKLAPRLPPVWGDTTQLRQIIHNLLRNAEDAQEALTMRRSSNQHATPDGMAELVVSDQRPGFPPEIIARVFEPYVTTKARGTGLGLAIVKKIVDEHHGPRQDQQPSAGRRRSQHPVAAGLPAHPQAALKHTTFRDLTMAQVLIVDDEMGIRELLSEILADEGHSVWLAENAAAARKLRAENGPIWSCSTSGCRIPTASRCSRSGPRPAC